MSSVDDLLQKFKKAYQRDLRDVDDEDPPRIPSGIFALDLAIGGGFPAGRTTVLFGPPSSMKSTVALKAVASAQKMYPNLKHVYVDIEGSYSKEWAAKMGVDTGSIVVLAPDTAEQMVDVVEQLLYADDIGMVVVDSLAALTTNRELESSAEDALPGNAGILINKFYRKTTRALARRRADQNLKALPTLLCINQIRYKIGVIHGDPETMPGGPSFMFASSMTLRLYGKDEMDKEVSDSLPAFKKVSVVVRKWKVPITSKNAEFMVALLPNQKFGLDVGGSYDLATILTYAKAYDLLTKADSGWQFLIPDTGELKPFQTQDKFKELLVMDPEFSESARRAIIARVVERISAGA